MFKVGIGTYIEKRWVGVAVGVMVHGPSVQDDDGVLRDELPVIGEILTRNVGSPQPEWVVAAFDLLNFCQPLGQTKAEISV